MNLAKKMIIFFISLLGLSLFAQAEHIIEGLEIEMTSPYLKNFVNRAITKELSINDPDASFSGHIITKIVRADRNSRPDKMVVESSVEFEGVDPEFGDPMYVYYNCVTTIMRNSSGFYDANLSLSDCTYDDPENDDGYIDWYDYYGYDQD